MKYFFYILAALACAGNLLASDVTANFSDANELYSKGKFPEAAASYQTILNSGVVSPNLLFNDGNAEFKSGNLGRAIAAFRRAALLAPRDADIRANLNFARNQVQSPTFHESYWQKLLGSLTLNEWAAFAAVALWLTLGLYAAMQIRPELKNVLGTPARLAVVATIVLAVCLGIADSVHFSKPVAVVLLPDAVTRIGPFDDAQNAFAVHDGAELPVLDQRNGWVQVSDNNGRTGWMPAAQVEVLPAI
jgi:tetratricopeptide (TPR) repeat protein